MLIRKDPKNPNDYIIVNSSISEILHSNGFKPIYMSLNGDKIYFKKEKDLMNFIYDNNII